MPDQEKLQELFNAALKSHHEDYTKNPADLRAGPKPSPVATSAALAAPVQAVAEENSTATAEKPARGLSASESEELGILLDEQVHRRKRRHRMEALVTALVLFGMTGGGFAWFVQESTRVQAFQEALREIRSVGDIKRMVASYQDSLDRISARSNQIDDASKAMGTDPSKCTNEDSYMEEEMSAMMGKESGQTVGSRNKRLRENFGDMTRKSDVHPAKDHASRETELVSFDWNH